MSVPFIRYSMSSHLPYILGGAGAVAVAAYFVHSSGMLASAPQKSAQQAQKLQQKAKKLYQQAAQKRDSNLWAQASECENQANMLVLNLRQQAAKSQEAAKAAQSVQLTKQGQPATQAQVVAPQSTQAVQSAMVQGAQAQAQVAIQAQSQIAAQAQSQVQTSQSAMQMQASLGNTGASASSAGLADSFQPQYPGFPGSEVDFITQYSMSDEDQTREFQKQAGVPRPTQIGNVHQPVDSFLGSYRDFEMYNSGCYPSADAYVYPSTEYGPSGPGPMNGGIDSATVLKPGLYPEITTADGFSQITIDGPRNLAWTDNVFDESTALNRNFNQSYDLRPEPGVDLYSPDKLSAWGMSVSSQGRLGGNTAPVRQVVA